MSITMISPTGVEVKFVIDIVLLVIAGLLDLGALGWELQNRLRLNLPKFVLNTASTIAWVVFYAKLVLPALFAIYITFLQL